MVGAPECFRSRFENNSNILILFLKLFYRFNMSREAAPFFQAFFILLFLYMAVQIVRNTTDILQKFKDKVSFSKLSALFSAFFSTLFSAFLKAFFPAKLFLFSPEIFQSLFIVIL